MLKHISLVCFFFYPFTWLLLVLYILYYIFIFHSEDLSKDINICTDIIGFVHHMYFILNFTMYDSY